MRLRRHDHPAKTAGFALIHLSIAIALGWWLTGSFVLAGAIALLEPLLNTAAHAVFDRTWVRRHGPAPSLRKTAAFAAIHFVNALGVAWAVTGSLAVAGALALLEPLVNAVALYAYDHWWSAPWRRLQARRAARMARAAAAYPR